jgi:glycosyltransferase involved in cell wall biosynthesis
VNVAIFTDNDFDDTNGVTTTLTAALQFAPADIRLRIYAASALGVDQPHYLRLRSVGMPNPFYSGMPMYVPRLFEYARRARKDEIHVVHVTTPGPIGVAGMYVAWRLGLPAVGSIDRDPADCASVLSGSPRLRALIREYARWPYRRCEQVLVPSESTRVALMETGGHPELVRVWPRGVDASLFDPVRRSTQLRERWHVCEKRPAILYVGRVSREKGLGMLPSLHRHLHRCGVEHCLVIAGDGPMLPELREAIPDAVFTGMLSRRAVAEVFASADLFVFPSITDAAGTAVLEAQASGLPVVVAGSGGPREQMRDGETGVVCDTENATAWALAIAALLRDRDRRVAMGRAAREYAVSRRWDQALQPLYRAYRDVVKDRAAPLQSVDRRVIAGSSRAATVRDMLIYLRRLLTILLCAAAPASAQFETSSQLGTVRDASGAAVADATITLTNTETGVGPDHLMVGRRIPMPPPQGNIELRAEFFNLNF